MTGGEASVFAPDPVWLPRPKTLGVTNWMRRPYAYRLFVMSTKLCRKSCTEFWTNDNRLKAAAGALAVNVLESA